jgi:outer membrane protein
MIALLLALSLGSPVGAPSAPAAPSATAPSTSTAELVPPLPPTTGEPLTLDKALELARRNPVIAQSQAQLLQAGGQVGIARSGFLPSASIGGKAGWTATDLGAAPSGALYATYGVTATLSQTIWDFGRTLGAYQAARDLERAAQADVENSWIEVEYNVRRTYYTAVATEALVAVADQTVASNLRQLELARGQFEVGTRPRFDVTTADVNVQQSRIAQIQARDAVTLARIALSQAVGQDVARRPLVAPVLPSEIELDVATLMDRATAGRPDLRAAQFSISASEAGLSAARSAWYPILGVGLNYAWNRSEYPVIGGLPAPDANSWSILGTITWPFLNGGADMARVDVQKGALASSTAQRDQLLLQVRTDVEQGVSGVKEARARREVAHVLVGQARENLDLAEGRYQAGLGTIIDVTTSQTSYTSAQAQEVKAIFDLASAWALLQNAIGK